MTEFRIRLRNPASPIILICILVLCEFLMPTAEASYAVITINGMKPVMSSDTMIVAAGTVFGALVFPIYLLVLGAGYSRDRRLGIDSLYRSSPFDIALLFTARMLANSILVTFSSLVVLALLVLTVSIHFGAPPHPLSFIIYLLTMLPVALIAVTLSSVIDRYLTSDLAKSAVAFFIWDGVMIASVIGHFDLFGVSFLARNIVPGWAGTDLSVGIIAAKNFPTVPWKTVELTTDYTTSRLLLMGGALILSGIVCLVSRYGKRAAYPSRQSTPQVASVGHCERVAPTPDELRRATVSHVSAVRAGILLANRWLIRAKWTWITILLSFLFAIVFIESPQPALAIALTVPITILGRGHRTERGTCLISLELTTPALWRPTPTFFSSLVLAVLMAAPVLPALLHLPLMRGVHIILGLLVSSMWLSWTCTSLARPLLGISTYLFIWYLTACNTVPPAADILGVNASSAISLMGVSVGVILLASLMYRERQRA